jgi:hypothetical protein
MTGFSHERRDPRCYILRYLVEVSATGVPIGGNRPGRGAGPGGVYMPGSLGAPGSTRNGRRW